MAECNRGDGAHVRTEFSGGIFGKAADGIAGGGRSAQLELTREYVRNGFRLLERESHELDVHGNPKVFLTSMFGIVENGKLLRTWGIQRDISERLKADEARRKAEDALRESEERYRAFVEQSSEGIFRMEYNPPIPCDLPIAEQLALGRKNGYLAECNDALAKMYGRASARELMGKPLSDFLVLNDPGTRKFMENFILCGIPDDGSGVVRDGLRRTEEDFSQHHERDGGGWALGEDLGDHARRDRASAPGGATEKCAATGGDRAAGWRRGARLQQYSERHHGPWRIAAGGCRRADERARNGLEQIRRAADRAASLTHQLLAFSRKQVLQPKVLDLNDAVADVKKMLSRVIGEDIELVANLHPSLLAVKADPGQVEQVLMNLAINARDAMPHGGNS